MSDETREYVCYVDGSGMHLRAPAEEIVRCRDCEHAYATQDGGLACEYRSLSAHVTHDDAFCSDGVRRESTDGNGANPR